MKKIILFLNTALISNLAFAQLPSNQPWRQDGNSITNLEFLGTTNQQDLRFYTNNTQKMVLTTGGKLGIGNVNPLFLLDITSTSGSQGARITQTSTGPAILHLNNAYVSPGGSGRDWSLCSSGAGDIWGLGHFALLEPSGLGLPSLFVDGNTKNISLGGNYTPNASLHIGDGTGSLHFGNKGVLIKFASGDRSLLEMHDPTGANRLVMQSRADACYLTSFDDKPLLLQTSLTGSGDVGIGMSSPGLIGAKLHISTINNPAGTAFFIDHFNTGNYGYAALIDVRSDYTKAFAVQKVVGNTGAEVFKVMGTGKTQIGTENSISHPYALLSVDGEIVCKGGLFVTNIGDWADYVFEPNYKLPNLYDIEKFYKIHKHLPEIPSEKEIQDSGVDVVQMNKLLLKKVEEMTIMMVKQQKEIDALKSKTN